ncbi:MAG TPA: molybdenum cofactor guanylyltransferase [Parafilimonas sp.]|nr:molybdenum cofactor guanylyltransferase [Parafilimonas sp.]
MITSLPVKTKLYGLVVCGGNSSRMGFDKSMIAYHEEAQWRNLCKMLSDICDRVFISCNESQSQQFNEYETLVDSDRYKNVGPMTAVLTAFSEYPGNDFLVLGCDYPLLSGEHLRSFVQSSKDNPIAAAFYNAEETLFEPLLALYTSKAGPLLLSLFEQGRYSLQYFLGTVDACKYFPTEKKIIKSIDTPGDLEWAKKELQKRQYQLQKI